MEQKSKERERARQSQREPERERQKETNEKKSGVDHLFESNDGASFWATHTLRLSLRTCPSCKRSIFHECLKIKTETAIQREFAGFFFLLTHTHTALERSPFYFFVSVCVYMYSFCFCVVSCGRLSGLLYTSSETNRSSVWKKKGDEEPSLFCLFCFWFFFF